MGAHVEAMLGFLDDGAEVFDYGNSIRAEARLAGVERAFEIPGFVPAYIRPQFCEGRGPFRWAALSGDPADIAATDRAVLDLFGDDEPLARWMRLAGEKVRHQGLPARICWLGYGERHRAGERFNEMVASGELSAPVVIGRDHLDAGSVASPHRETEAMIDGSDAIADWPLLNALLNTASGASWVSLHHGGGVGIGRSIHAGQVCVADGSELAGRKIARVLTNDPGTGVIRHADAGYPRALEVADERGVRIPLRETRRERRERSSPTSTTSAATPVAAAGRATSATTPSRPAGVVRRAGRAARACRCETDAQPQPVGLVGRPRGSRRRRHRQPPRLRARRRRLRRPARRGLGAGGRRRAPGARRACRARPLAVVVFAEEEGGRFGVPCLGSRLLTGSLDPDRARGLRDPDGVTLAEALTGRGHDPAALGPEPERLARLGRFVELHVEQGRALGPRGAGWPSGRRSWRTAAGGCRSPGAPTTPAPHAAPTVATR